MVCDSCEQKTDKQCTFDECRALLIKRLADYEDTGLTPKEVTALERSSGRCRKWRARRMATKRVCDRCGAEINPTSSATYVNIRRAFHEKSPDIELCCSCAMQIKEWLKSRVEEGKKDG